MAKTRHNDVIMKRYSVERSIVVEVIETNLLFAKRFFGS
jgi:hypothetical protein